MKKSWLILVLVACLPLAAGLDCDIAVDFLGGGYGGGGYDVYYGGGYDVYYGGYDYYDDDYYYDDYDDYYFGF